MSARTAKAIYRVTASESPEVPVGKFIVDYDQGKIGYWHLFDATEASFKNGWTGVRTFAETHDPSTDVRLEF